MKILAIQPNIDNSANAAEKKDFVLSLINLVESEIEKHKDQDIDLVVLPELSTVEYSREAFANLNELAEDFKGPSFQLFSALAKKHSTYISFSLPRKEKGKFFISNFVVNRSGELCTYYDKMHLAQFGASMEKEYFSRGKGISVFEIGAFKVGIIICYDIRFAAQISHLRQKLGVNVILHPVAFTKDSTFASWHDFVITRALENHIYFLSLNRAGDDWGQSIFCPPWVDDNIHPEVFGTDQESKVFKLDIASIDSARRSFSFLEDNIGDYSKLKINKVK